MKNILLTLTLIFVFTSVFAQQDMLLYNIHGIPQSSYANPSNRFDGKFYIGIPALSSDYVNFSTSFKQSDILIREGDSLLLDFSKLKKQKNYIAFNTRIDVLSFGFNVSPSTQIMMNVTEVISLSLKLNKDLFRLVNEGNAAFLGTTPNLSDMGVNATHYREYGISVNHQLNEKLRLGTRLKYLYGMENIYTQKSDLSLVTDAETYELTVETDVNINTSGFNNEKDGTKPFDKGVGNYVAGRNNRGFGVDLGAFYELNDKFSFSASIVDLGFIRWNDFTKTYTSKGSYSFDGVDIDVFGNDTLGNDPFDEILDTLSDELGFTESTGSYSSPLVTKVYLGGNYQINERSFAGLVFKSDIFRGEIIPSYSVSYGRKMTKWITLTGAYSSINGTYNNLGLGAVFDPGPVQFYIMTDNTFGMFYLREAQNLHVRFGINLIFGRNKVDKKIFNKGSKKSLQGTTPVQSDSSINLINVLDSTAIQNAEEDINTPADSTSQDSLNGGIIESEIDSTNSDSTSKDSLNGIIMESAIDSTSIEELNETLPESPLDSSLQKEGTEEIIAPSSEEEKIEDATTKDGMDNTVPNAEEVQTESSEDSPPSIEKTDEPKAESSTPQEDSSDSAENPQSDK